MIASIIMISGVLDITTVMNPISHVSIVDITMILTQDVVSTIYILIYLQTFIKHIKLYIHILIHKQKYLTKTLAIKNF